MNASYRSSFAILVTFLAFAAAEAQSSRSARPFAGASHIVMPQHRGFALERGHAGIEIERIQADVQIVGETARTTLAIRVRNPGLMQAEAVLLLPVPAHAAVSAFAFEGSASEPTAELLPRDEARRLYDQIVAQIRDPALLEFAGYNLIRSSVFPVTAGGTQMLQLTYEEVLGGDGARLDYTLARSESLDARRPWEITVRIKGVEPISMVYSPTHDLDINRVAAGEMQVDVKESSRRDPGPFVLSILRESAEVSASLFAYPDPAIGGGYFLMVAGLPASAPKLHVPREVTVVIDRSGSMAGEKMDQVSAAALQMIEGLEDREYFNLIDYSTAVSSLFTAPREHTRENVLAARAYLQTLRTTGGTNIYDALVEALRQPPRDGVLPLVVFLTDGVPTVGKTSESAIREMGEAGNPHHRRIFTLGVGADVNAPLLDRLADLSRGQSNYIRPGADVEVGVATVFKKLKGPVLSSIEIQTLDGDKAIDTTRIREVMPGRIPDLFEGDSLVMLGQYRGAAPLHLRMSGEYLGGRRSFDYVFALDHATTRNAFVPRLWAARRIAMLVDQIRQGGAHASLSTRIATLPDDPATREVIEEIMRLSTEFGILSEYTSFLAREGTDLADWGRMVESCGNELDELAVKTRSGIQALTQAENYNAKKMQSKMNYVNTLLDAESTGSDATGQILEFSNVQQVCDRAFVKQKECWIDTRIVAAATPLAADQEVEIGSEAHLALLWELVAENRQGMICMEGEVLIRHKGKNILVKNGTPAASTAGEK